MRCDGVSQDYDAGSDVGDTLERLQWVALALIIEIDFVAMNSDESVVDAGSKMEERRRGDEPKCDDGEEDEKSEGELKPPLKRPD